MTFTHWSSSLALLIFAGGSVGSAADRTFDFNYAFTVTSLQPGENAKIWIPLAASDSGQAVSVTEKSLPGDAIQTTDSTALNPMYFVSAIAAADGSIPLSIHYHVTRHEVRSLPVRPSENVADDLNPNQLVPLGGRPGQLIDSATLPGDDRAKARVLFDFVYDFLSYSKDKPGWGRGDVIWACDSRSGNCSDFHSLFLSLCRTNHLPAKMEFGFIIPAADKPQTVGNYHCWAYFLPSGSGEWIPVDISKAKNRPAEKENFFAHLDSDRMGFSTGRDLILSPPQAGPPLNFFVYPYVEVEGKAWPAEKIVRSFSIAAPTTAPAK